MQPSLFLSLSLCLPQPQKQTNIQKKCDARRCGHPPHGGGNKIRLNLFCDSPNSSKMARAQTQHWINRTLRMAKVCLPTHWHANVGRRTIYRRRAEYVLQLCLSHAGQRRSLTPLTRLPNPCRQWEAGGFVCLAREALLSINPLHTRVKMGGGEAVAERQETRLAAWRKRRVQRRTTSSPSQVRSPRSEVPCPFPSQTHPYAQTPVCV